MRNVHAGKACATSEAQSGPSQVDKLTESVASRVPFGNSKEVTIFQIGDKSLHKNVEEEMEDSVPPSILGETLPMEKRLVMSPVETKCLKRDKTDTLPTIQWLKKLFQCFRNVDYMLNIIGNKLSNIPEIFS